MKRQTRVLRVDPAEPDPSAVSIAAEMMRKGGLVAFPTETVYGLGANAFDSRAVSRIFLAKGRPIDNPIIVHVAGPGQIEAVAQTVPPQALALANRFWPGPLTLVLGKSAAVSDKVTAGLGTVAVRMPRHPVALGLIRASGVPVAAPSANVSGRPSGTTGAHVLDDLDGKVDVVLDAGPVEIGVESTVLDLTVSPPAVLRPGAVTLEELEAVIGPVLLGRRDDLLRRSPGTRHRHYSPRTRLTLVDETDGAALSRLVEGCARGGRRVGVMTRRPELYQGSEVAIVRMMPHQSAAYASQMFAAMRELDSQGLDEILVGMVEEEGIGVAVMDRLRRAASGQ